MSVRQVLPVWSSLTWCDWTCSCRVKQLNLRSFVLSQLKLMPDRTHIPDFLLFFPKESGGFWRNLGSGRWQLSRCGSTVVCVNCAHLLPPALSPALTSSHGPTQYLHLFLWLRDILQGNNWRSGKQYCYSDLIYITLSRSRYSSFLKNKIC